MSEEWALWRREERGEWEQVEAGLRAEGALRCAQALCEHESRYGTARTWAATPADQRPPSLERDPQVTLPARLCLGLGGVCRLDAGHEGEHRP